MTDKADMIVIDNIVMQAKPGPTSAKGASVLAQTLAAPPLQPKKGKSEQGGGTFSSLSYFPPFRCFILTDFSITLQI